ncbi:glycosyltransferase [bacterium]|nr:glycosyltransferase [bacterium]
MKILQLCLRFPFPPRDGGTMAMASLSAGLKANGVELQIAALNTAKHPVPDHQIAAAKKSYQIHSYWLDNRIGLVNTALNLFSNKAFHVSRFYAAHIEQALIDLLHKYSFDAVVFESIFMAPYLPVVQKHSKAVTVLRSHNIEYLIWQRVCDESTNPLKKAYLNIQMGRLKKYELETSGQFDIIAAITPVDAHFYRGLAIKSKVIDLPFGIDNLAQPLQLSSNDPYFHIGFLGSMDWIPNQEGIRWFVSEVWPLIESKNAGIKCHIAGRHMPADLLAKNAGHLHIEAEVADSQTFFAQLQLSVVPLRSGSGVRIKVLESMAMGLPVLATEIGYEGIEASNGTSIIEANTANEFAEAVLQLAHDFDKLQYIAANARKLIEKKYGVAKAAGVLINEINKLESGL